MCELVCDGVGVFELVEDIVVKALNRALADVDVLPVTLLDFIALGVSDADALKLAEFVVRSEALAIALATSVADEREEEELHALAKAEGVPRPSPALALALVVAEFTAVPRALADVEPLRLNANVRETVAVTIALDDFDGDAHAVAEEEGVPEAVELGDAVSFDDPVA